MRLIWLGSFLAALMVMACDGAAPVPEAPTLEEPREPAAKGAPVKLTPLQQLGRSLAIALKDPKLRAQLHESLARSEVKEGKLHLQRLLLTPGEPWMAAMSQAAHLHEADLPSLLAQLDSMELYLPVEEHRLRWKGDSQLIVVTQQRDHEVPTGFDLDGLRVPLSLEKPPETPALVIVPAESFDEQGLAYEKYRVPAGPHPALTAWTGLWVNEMHTYNLYESWPRGDPEFELHVEGQENGERQSLVCAEQDVSVEPFRWDMNKKDYYLPFLAAEQDMLPVGTPRVISLWEDDNGRCVIKAESDWVKLTTDAFMNAAEVYKLIQSKDYLNGQIIVHASNAYINARNLIDGADEYVGTVAVPDDITTSAKEFLLRNEEKAVTGRGYLQWKTDTAH